MDIYNSDDFDIQSKADESPLTKADLYAHEVIKNYLEKTDIPILSEEGKEIPYEIRKTWKQLWIVDPIDGTKEFIKKNGEFTVNIALIEDQKPILGVVYAPALGELYFASREKGAFKINLKDNTDLSVEDILATAKKLPINSSHSNRNKNTYTVVASKSHLSEETIKYIDELKTLNDNVVTVQKGSSLKFCIVAEGSANCYPRFGPTMEWDTAAAQAICEFSGKQVNDFVTNTPILYNRKNLLNSWFLVS